jgi:hypothetical protein
MKDVSIKKADLLDLYHDRARNKENLQPYYEKFIGVIIIYFFFISLNERLLNLFKTNNYHQSLVYNLDETSLLVKKQNRPSVVWSKGMCSPSYQHPDQIFACTAIFVVCADGTHSRTTLILNAKAAMAYLEDFVRSDADVRFYFFIFLFFL